MDRRNDSGKVLEDGRMKHLKRPLTEARTFEGATVSFESKVSLFHPYPAFSHQGDGYLGERTSKTISARHRSGVSRATASWPWLTVIKHR